MPAGKLKAKQKREAKALAKRNDNAEQNVTSPAKKTAISLAKELDFNPLDKDERLAFMVDLFKHDAWESGITPWELEEYWKQEGIELTGGTLKNDAHLARKVLAALTDKDSVAVQYWAHMFDVLKTAKEVLRNADRDYKMLDVSSAQGFKFGQEGLAKAFATVTAILESAGKAAGIIAPSQTNVQVVLEVGDSREKMALEDLKVEAGWFLEFIRRDEKRAKEYEAFRNERLGIVTVEGE